jgi:hypothetical protein
MHLSSTPYVPHVLPISVFLTWSPELYLVNSTGHKVPCYVVFSTPLLLIHLGPKYPPQHPILKKCFLSPAKLCIGGLPQITVSWATCYVIILPRIQKCPEVMFIQMWTWLSKNNSFHRQVSGSSKWALHGLLVWGQHWLRPELPVRWPALRDAEDQRSLLERRR